MTGEARGTCYVCTSTFDPPADRRASLVSARIPQARHPAAKILMVCWWWMLRIFGPGEITLNAVFASACPLTFFS